MWLYGIMFMVGAGYTLLHGGHVRVDVFYRPASARYKAWVDLFGSLFLMTPVLVMILMYSYPYVATSWRMVPNSMPMVVRSFSAIRARSSITPMNTNSRLL